MIAAVYTPHIGRTVWLRDGAGESDRDAWSDAFTGLYHVPPAAWPPPGTILDLGCNIGLTCAHYEALYQEATIIGVEMDPSTAAIARRNTSAEVVTAAVSYYTGEGTYDASRHRPWGYHLDPAGSRRVNCIALCDLILSKFGPAGCDLVKMDIEGEEWPLLEQPDWAPYVDRLLIELHAGLYRSDEPEQLVEEAVDLLEAAGYIAEPQLRHPQAVQAWTR